MIFSIQRFLEDYFEGRSLRDVDQFAVSIANLYDNRRSQMSDTEFLRAMRETSGRFSTRSNSSLIPADFEGHLLKLLDGRFHPKKKDTDTEPKFLGDLSSGEKPRHCSPTDYDQSAFIRIQECDRVQRG